MNNFDSLVGDSQVVLVLCNQFGDTGKGKIVDFFARHWAHLCFRGTGADNAGHTTVHDGKKYVFHLLPSGMPYDKDGLVNGIGNGVGFYPASLVREIMLGDSLGLTFNNFMISKDASVFTPYHIARDQALFNSLKGGNVGSTGKGVGPGFTDKIYRKGIFVDDLYNPDLLYKKIKESLFFTGEYKFGFSKKRVTMIERDASGHAVEKSYTLDDIMHEMAVNAVMLKPFVRDTISYIHKSLGEGKNILVEGAQGLLLSPEFGVRGMCTSSDCSKNGTATGIGIDAGLVDLTVGLVKFPFMSKVGGGPYPSEIGGIEADIYCRDEKNVNLRTELEKAKVPYKVDDGKIKYDHGHENIRKLMNSQDPIEQNRGIGLAAEEFGATTGRKRRMGWTDLVAQKYAGRINGPHVILTKPDAISGIEKYSLCTGYRDVKGMVHTDFNRSPDFLRSVSPVLTDFSGYGDISQVKEYDALPESLRQGIAFFERYTGANVLAVSNGPERDKLIKR